MEQERHSVDQIVSKLRKADVELGKEKKVPEVCKQLGITEQTYYHWRQKYGGTQPEMVKQIKSLEKENARLKNLVADQVLDMEILNEAARAPKITTVFCGQFLSVALGPVHVPSSPPPRADCPAS